jgi:hypothetical protein
MSAYTDLNAILAYSQKTIGMDMGDAVTDWITSASQFIETYTGRIFTFDFDGSPTPKARLFEGTNRQILIIDDLLTVDELTVEVGDRYGDNFTTIDAADYQALPLDRGVEIGEGVFQQPITAIGLKRRAWGVGIHRITGYWAYSVYCPADIKFAATVLVTGMLNGHLNTERSVKSETIGNYSVSYSDAKGAQDYDRALAILDGYRRLTI